MQNFEAQSGSPRIIGAIDGTHIRIRAPVNQANAYFNRTKYIPLIPRQVILFLSCFYNYPKSCNKSLKLRFLVFFSLPDMKCKASLFL